MYVSVENVVQRNECKIGVWHVRFRFETWKYYLCANDAFGILCRVYRVYTKLFLFSSFCFISFLCVFGEGGEWGLSWLKLYVCVCACVYEWRRVEVVPPIHSNHSRPLWHERAVHSNSGHSFHFQMCAHKWIYVFAMDRWQADRKRKRVLGRHMTLLGVLVVGMEFGWMYIAHALYHGMKREHRVTMVT